MTAILRSLAVAGALALAACDGRTTGPPVVPEPESAPAPGPIAPSFDQAVWDGLLFDARACPPGEVSPGGSYLGIPSGSVCPPLEEREAKVIDWVPDFFIETGQLHRVYDRHEEEWGVDADEYVEWATRAIVDAHEQITGASFTGAIRSGPEGELRPRQILIEWEEDYDADACAYATLGEEEGRVVFVLNRINHVNGFEVFCGAAWLDGGGLIPRDDRGTLMHEIGHNYGLYHAGESLMVAAGCESAGSGRADWRGRCDFSSRDQFHTQLAYATLKRGQKYVARP